MRIAGKPLLLMILDGWGMQTGGKADALAQSRLPVFRGLWDTCPHARLATSGLAVGLPEGQMGNSEVGHTNIGSGRVVYQDVVRINMAVKDGSFFSNPAFLAACDHVKQSGGKLHLYGLLSDGGVHSQLDHLIALLQLAKEQQIERVFVHCFTDGRDTPPKSAVRYIRRLQAKMDELGVGRIAGVCGRFYAMDRDKRWDRLERAWRALTYGEGHRVDDAEAGVLWSYDQGLTDEFIEPLLVCPNGEPPTVIEDGDAIIFYNYRADRAREISHAFTDDDEDFPYFPRLKRPQVFYTAMTAYDDHLKAAVAYPPSFPQNTFGEVIAKAGLRQLRIAETEKYAHVTFFFNGGREDKFLGEDRVLIASPKVATYDLRPQMSAPEVTDEVIRRIDTGNYDVIILNYANPDMVGHTGSIPAVKQAVEYLDTAISRVLKALAVQKGTAIITADHGNAEEMIDPSGNPMTAHTCGPVPIILVGGGACRLKDGALCDIAPTMLQLLDIPQPKEMTGVSLLQK